MLISVLYFLKYSLILRWLIVIAILLLIDVICWFPVKSLTKSLDISWKMNLKRFVWSLSIIFYVLLAFFMLFHQMRHTAASYSAIYWLISFFIFWYLPRLIIFIFWLPEVLIFNFIKIFFRKAIKYFYPITKTGLLLSCVLTIVLLSGTFYGRYRFRVINQDINIKGLPASFDGFKIAQVSDIHIGSFCFHKKKFAKAINLITAQHPDIIFFTGDLVNYFSDEAIAFGDEFKKLKAPYGLYSIRGNHDYGAYIHWMNDSARNADNAKILEFEKNVGFKFLSNEHVAIIKNNDSLFIAGVENWGHPPFPQLGDVNKAISGINHNQCIILLSHDPDYWDVEIKKIEAIKLTLSGHTHGMQIGLKWAGKEYSPASLRFKQWGGLYEYNGRFLYVNRGLGSIGLPARIGMRPEITVITLHRI